MILFGRFNSFSYLCSEFTTYCDYGHERDRKYHQGEAEASRREPADACRSGWCGTEHTGGYRAGGGQSATQDPADHPRHTWFADGYKPKDIGL